MQCVLESFAKKPWILEKIVADAVWKIAGKIWTSSSESLRNMANQALVFLSVLDAVCDGVVKLSAPDVEKKETVAGLTEPVQGAFLDIDLGDPTLCITASGNVSESTFNTTKLYNIQDLCLNVSASEDGTAAFVLALMPSGNFTGDFVAFLTDPDYRSMLLTYFGVESNETTLIVDNQTLIVESNGISLGSFDKLYLQIGNGTVNGYLQQPFGAPVTNGTCDVNLSMSYPFGEGLTYTVDVVLPVGSVGIEVLSGGNYSLRGTTVSWTEPVDSIWVTFTPPAWIEEYFGAGGYPIVDFAALNGELYAAASSTLYVHDGASWSTVNAPCYVTSLEPYQSKLIVGGQGGLYSFNGTAFDLVFPVTTYIKPLGVYNNTLYAGTFLDNPPTLYYCNGSADNPDNWHIDTGFSAILNFSGPFGSIDSFAEYNGILYITSGGTIYSFNGTDWNIANTFDDVYGFSCMKAYNSKLYLATRDQGWRKPLYQGGTGFSGRVIEFDGENWTTVLDHDYWVYSLEVYDNKLYAGTANKIFTYNGTSWETSFNATEGAYYAISMIIYDGKIYAGMGNGYIFADPAPAKTNPETIVVPEFPPTTILAVFMALTMLATALTRKNRTKRFG